MEGYTQKLISANGRYTQNLRTPGEKIIQSKLEYAVWALFCDRLFPV
jgi:hypothetical protein